MRRFRKCKEKSTHSRDKIENLKEVPASIKSPQQRESLTSKVATRTKANKIKTTIKSIGFIAILVSRKMKKTALWKENQFKKGRRVLRRGGDNQTLNQAR